MLSESWPVTSIIQNQGMIPDSGVFRVSWRWGEMGCVRKAGVVPSASELQELSLKEKVEAVG